MPQHPEDKGELGIARKWETYRVESTAMVGRIASLAKVVVGMGGVGTGTTLMGDIAVPASADFCR
jgi:hypothetical protein